jgi:hypothetical protein
MFVISSVGHGILGLITEMLFSSSKEKVPLPLIFEWNHHHLSLVEYSRPSQSIPGGRFSEDRPKIGRSRGRIMDTPSREQISGPLREKYVHFVLDYLDRPKYC